MNESISIFNLQMPSISHVMEEGSFLFGYRGSIAHNLFLPKEDPNSIDDVDLLGFVLAPVEHYLGLAPWGSRGTKEYWVGHYDCVYYEIKKAFSLLLQGNPNILCFLWNYPQHYIYQTDAGRELLSIRDSFLGKHIYQPLAGYAAAQLQKMETRDPADLRLYLAITAELKYRGIHPQHKGEFFPTPDYSTGEARDVQAWDNEKLLQRNLSYQKKGENLGYLGDKRKQLILDRGYDSKNAAHCIRLLRMAKELFLEGTIHTYRNRDREELLAIKNGKWTLPEIKEAAETLFREVKDACATSALPDGPDRQKVEETLMRILRNHLDANR